MSTQTAPTSDNILILGKRLGTANDITSLISEVTHFIQEQFKRQCFVLIHNSLMNSTHPRKNEPFPFDPHDILNQKIPGNFLQIELNHQSWLIIELNYSNEALGRLVILNDDPLEKSSVDMLLTVAELASAHFFAKLQAQLHEWRHKQLALVRSVSERISQTTDLDVLSCQITELVQSTFGFYYVAIFLVNHENSRLQFKASASAEKTDRPDFCPFHAVNSGRQ